jgi:hypothetical protein
MLGKGTIADKAELLFDEWDEDGSGYIERKEAMKFIKRYFNIVVNDVPHLGIGLPEDGLCAQFRI